MLAKLRRDKSPEATRAYSRQQSRKWRAAHPGYGLEAVRTWRAAHPGYNLNPPGAYRKLKARAKQKGRDVLSKEEFLAWYATISKVCTFCKIPEEKLHLLERFGPAAIHRLSVDRIDSNEGYTQGNIQLACLVCNRVKSNIFSNAAMRKIAAEFLTPLWAVK